MEKTLSDIILDAFRGVDGWLSRNEIAALIGRERGLLPYDKQILTELVEAGHLEQRRGVRGVAGKRFEYRLKGVQNG